MNSDTPPNEAVIVKISPELIDQGFDVSRILEQDFAGRTAVMACPTCEPRESDGDSYRSGCPTCDDQGWLTVAQYLAHQETQGNP